MELELKMPAHTARTYFHMTINRVKREIASAFDTFRPIVEFHGVHKKLLEEVEQLKEQISSLKQVLATSDVNTSTNNNKVNSIDPELLSMSIIKLGLSVRSLGILKAARIYTVGDLMCYDEDDLMRLRNMGVRSVSDVQECLERIGLRLDSRD